jgi:hypothetical protein
MLQSANPQLLAARRASHSHLLRSVSQRLIEQIESMCRRKAFARWTGLRLQGSLSPRTGVSTSNSSSRYTLPTDLSALCRDPSALNPKPSSIHGVRAVMGVCITQTSVCCHCRPQLAPPGLCNQHDTDAALLAADAIRLLCGVSALLWGSCRHTW